MEVQGGGPHDPWQWVYLAAAGFLGAIGKHIYAVLWGTPRPEGEHSNAYLAEQMRQMLESQETMQATLQGFDRRLKQLESRRATAGD